MRENNHIFNSDDMPVTVSPADPEAALPVFETTYVHNAAPIWQRLLADGMIDESKCSAEYFNRDRSNLESCGYMFSRTVHFTFKMDNAEEVHHL